MLAALVHEHRDALAADIVDARAEQWKALAREIDDRWRVGQARREPGLHGVLVGRSDVDRPIAERRAHVARHELRVLARPRQVHADAGAQQQRERKGRR